jgi:hypothetical protein
VAQADGRAAAAARAAERQVLQAQDATLASKAEQATRLKQLLAVEAQLQARQ